MLLVGIVRQAWRGLLAALPAAVLSRLDRWAQRQAERRAARRRQALQARG